MVTNDNSQTLIKSQSTSYHRIELQYPEGFCLDHPADLDQTSHQVWIEVVQLTETSHVLHRNAKDSNNRLIDLKNEKNIEKY